MATRRLKASPARGYGQPPHLNSLSRGFTWLVEMVLFWPMKAAFAVTDHMETDTSPRVAATTMWRCAFVGLFYAFYLINICAVLDMV